MLREFKLPYILPEEEDVIRRLNYNPKKTELEENVIFMIRDLINKSKDFIFPRGLTIDLSFNHVDNKIILSDYEIVSTKLSNQLKYSKQLTIIAATIGYEILNKIQTMLKEENYTEAVILDAIASEAVESFVDYIQAILEREKKLYGYTPTMRYSPGYGDLSLDVNSYILNKLNAEKINLFVHPESKILIPEKSITAIIGWEK